MNLKKLPKDKIEKYIHNFFENIKTKNPKEIKKIKRLAMNKKISLKNYRKLFCKKCLTPYTGNEKIRIRNKMKSIKCKNCEFLTRYRI